MPRLAIVTQDPRHRGGVLRLVQFLYVRAESLGLQPEVLHYGANKYSPRLSLTTVNLLRGKFRPSFEAYEYEGMRCRKFGAIFPEWEPQRLRSSRHWASALRDFDAAFVVTGSAQTGYPLVGGALPFSLWLSATLADDRRERLSKTTARIAVERLGLPIIRRMEKEAIRQAKQVYAVSENSAEAVMKLGVRGDVALLPYPINTDKFLPKSEPRSDQYLFVGRAEDPRKNFGLFLDVARSLPSRTFTAVASDLRGAALPANILVKMSLSDEELLKLYRTSRALLVTSTHEGLGIAMMEAMAAGLPVITTHCGGPEMVINDGQNGAFADSTEEFSRKIRELDSGGRFEELSAAGVKTIQEQFSIHALSKLFDAALSELFTNS